MKLKYSFDFIEMDGDIIAVPIGENKENLQGIVKLNQSAADILEILREETTEEEIVNALVQKYETDRGTIATFVHAYIVQLEKDNFLS